MAAALATMVVVVVHRCTMVVVVLHQCTSTRHASLQQRLQRRW